jgi:hypothetical protein
VPRGDAAEDFRLACCDRGRVIADIDKVAEAIHAASGPNANGDTEYAHGRTVCRRAARAAVLSIRGVRLTETVYENLEDGVGEGINTARD